MSHITLSLRDNSENIQDLFLDDDGNLALSFDAEAVGEHVKNRTKTFEGEWFLNNAVGVPWIPQILSGEYNDALYQAIIKRVVRRTDGVTSIEEFSSTFDNVRRNAIAENITVRTIYED